MPAPTTQRPSISSAKPACVKEAQAVVEPSASKCETRSPGRQRMSAICAYRPTGIDVKGVIGIAATWNTAPIPMSKRDRCMFHRPFGTEDGPQCGLSVLIVKSPQFERSVQAMAFVFDLVNCSG